MFEPQVKDQPRPPFWETLCHFPLFILRLYVLPRHLLRRWDWSRPRQLARLSLYLLLWLGILVIAFDDNRVLAGMDKPLLSTFKGIVMRAHDRSWDWLSPVYEVFRLGQGEAKRLWDTLLTTGFLCYTFGAALLGVAVVARLRMWRYGLGWPHAIGTGLLGFMAGTAAVALSLVPLAELFICRECTVRLTLFALFNLVGWFYMGYYTLGDLGERPDSPVRLFLGSLTYGLVQYLLAYIVMLVLVITIIPM